MLCIDIVMRIIIGYNYTMNNYPLEYSGRLFTKIVDICSAS